MNTQSLENAIRRMIEKLPKWNEDAIIYRDQDGEYSCDPQSTFDTVYREYEITQIYQCHDLNDIFPDFGLLPGDAVWLTDQLVEQEQISQAASALGRLGGQSKSAAKQQAARENGKLGGRPKKSA